MLQYRQTGGGKVEEPHRDGHQYLTENMIIDEKVALQGKVVIIRRGKKKYYLGTVK